jgi:CHAD domain-containing protein
MVMAHNGTIREALALAWGNHLEALKQHLPGAMAGGDSEELHQFRVALRKTRALLTLFRDTLPEAASFKDEFKWLATATGAVRDLDVLSAQALRRTAALGVIAAHATPIVEELRYERAAALKKLGATLRSKRARSLVESWQRFLAALPARTDLRPATDVPAWTSIKPLVIKQSRRLLQEGLAVDTDPHDLHELRIRGKRLRYLLESFDAEVERHGVDRLAKKLRTLQTVLGNHQDATVAAARWQVLAQTLGRRGTTTPGTQALLEEWIAQAETEQAECRAAFSEALAKFARACKCL